MNLRKSLRKIAFFWANFCVFRINKQKRGKSPPNLTFAPDITLEKAKAKSWDKEKIYRAKTIVFLFLILFFLFILGKNISRIKFDLIWDFWRVSLSVLGLAVIFILIKSLMLYLSGRLFQIEENYLYFVKVFCMSSFFELTTFSGKLGADGFKYFFWKNQTRKRRLSLILFLRSADIFGFIWLFLFLILPWPLALSGIFLAIFLAWPGLRKKEKTNFLFSFREFLRKHGKTWLGISFIAITGYLIVLSQLSLVFTALGLEPSKKIMIIFLVSHGLGALSQLPFGLGVKDFSLFYQLKELILFENILLGLVWLRLFGEMVLVALGGIFAAIYLKKKTN